MKTFIISAIVLTAALPFLAFANTDVKVDRSNGLAYFGHRAEWQDVPVRHDPIWGDVQDICGTEWFKSQMRSIAQQLKAKGILSLFPSFQVWAN
jgi:hypothetical protein